MVLSEDLFKNALVREKKRAERFDEPFVLVLVAARADSNCEPATWRAVIGALSSSKRDTDIVGWFEHRSVMAMIVPEIDGTDVAFVREVESRVQLALATRLDADVRSSFSVRLHRHGGAHDKSEVLRSIEHSPRAAVRAALKRALDVIASAAFLAVAAPLFLLIAACVKLRSAGPVFFKQVRVGQHGKPVTMLKFRTMNVKSDDTIHKAFVSQLIKGATPGGDSTAAAPYKIVNDPRVTSVGRLLRKTSLDELPQFWNVLMGDMSLVGPRPPLAYEVEQYKPWHYRRVLEAKPGITGLWQVSGRSRTTFDDMVRLDLRYAKNPNAWADIKILLATPRAVISGKGAC